MIVLRQLRFVLPLLAIGAVRGHASAPAQDSGTDPGAALERDAAIDATASTRTQPPDVALAEVYAPEVDLDGYLISEKLDGVRAYWNGKLLVTRGGMVIQAPTWFTAGLPAEPLDGELWMGRGTFATLSGTVRRLQPDLDAWRRVRYVLFDLPRSGEPFAERFRALEDLVEAASNPFLGVVEQTRVRDHKALMALLDQVVADGGEGLMLHRRDAAYRVGRSDDLLKVKPYMEGEARVIAQLPGRGKFEGMLGSLLVETDDGRRFRIGTGFSDAERSAPPPVGSIVTFKHHGFTKNGLPRFASFIRVSADW